jgi:hypothetical protein
MGDDRIRMIWWESAKKEELNACSIRCQAEGKIRIKIIMDGSTISPPKAGLHVFLAIRFFFS